MSEIYYSIALPGESVKSKFQITLGNDDLESTLSTGDIELSDNKFISPEKLDEIFVKALYSQDFMDLFDFLDFHLAEFNGEKLRFLRKTKNVIDQYFAHESTLYYREDHRIQPHIDNPKTEEIYRWFKENYEQSEITADGENPYKLKWLGTAAQFGYVFLELAEKGFIEIPKTRSKDSFRKFALHCYNLFEINTTINNIVVELNPNSNSLTEPNREIFNIPKRSRLSK